jgi:hypothetical protein
VRKAREMRRLIDQLVEQLALPVPTDPDSLFAALTAAAGTVRGREIVVLKEEFPHRTATGLWLDMPEYDMIVVDKRATPLHQLAIFCHELWHMFKGDCGHHVEGIAVAGRLLHDRADLVGVVNRVAARTEFNERSEQDAETFALKAVTHFRVWLERDADSIAVDQNQIAGRIGASLGHRRSQV